MSIEDTLADIVARQERIEAAVAQIDKPIAVLALKIPQTATALNVDATTVYDLIRDGHLEAVVYPGMTAKRVPVAAVERFLASLANPTPQLQEAS